MARPPGSAIDRRPESSGADACLTGSLVKEVEHLPGILSLHPSSAGTPVAAARCRTSPARRRCSSRAPLVPQGRPRNVTATATASAAARGHFGPAADPQTTPMAVGSQTGAHPDVRKTSRIAASMRLKASGGGMAICAAYGQVEAQWLFHCRPRMAGEAGARMMSAARSSVLAAGLTQVPSAIRRRASTSQRRGATTASGTAASIHAPRYRPPSQPLLLRKAPTSWRLARPPCPSWG